LLRQTPRPGSIAFVPSVAGLLLAGEVVRDLIKKQLKRQTYLEENNLRG
jgi:tRNA A37 threonylcarbamoyladenosine dehydratase